MSDYPKNPNGFGAKTTGKEVAEKFKDIIAGKTILITGVAEGGLGGEASVTIASSLPKLLILSARSESRAGPIAEKIKAQYPSVEVRILSMDLGNLASVRKAAKEVASWNDVTLDVLINNAAVMACPYALTSDGFESQFGIGHLGHFVFTNTLLQDGKIKEGGRIVNVSSDGHRFGDVEFEDVGYSNGKNYHEWTAYGQVKTANMLYSLELAKRLKSRNILVFAPHPGVIDTNLGRHLNDQILQKLFDKDGPKDPNVPEQEGKNLQEGISTHLVSAFDPYLVNYSGAYLEDCSVAKPSKSYASDPEGAEKLWALSEKMVGEKFDL